MNDHGPRLPLLVSFAKFWGGGCQGNGTVYTFPPDTCQGGLGVGAKTLNVPIPMPALRQQ